MQYKAIMLKNKGGLEQLQPVELELLEPGEGQIRVKILRAGVGFTDVIMRRGYYPYAPKVPFVQGYEHVGVVDKVGPGVTQFKPGQTVAALTVYGSYAEYIIRDQDEFVIVPDGLDPSLALSLVLNYVTAYQMLTRKTNLQAGQSILITGGSGGVGQAFLDLGKALGLQVYATASPSKFDLIESLAGIPIDYHDKNWSDAVIEKSKGGVDAAFDGIGGNLTSQAIKSVKSGGAFVLYGFTSSVKNGKSDNLGSLVGMLSFGLSYLDFSKSKAFYGITSDYRKDKKPFKEDLARLFELLKEGKIHPQVAHVFSLDEAVKAQGLLEKSQAKGKIVLKIADR